MASIVYYTYEDELIVKLIILQTLVDSTAPNAAAMCRSDKDVPNFSLSTSA